jgi:hypothetical protein
VSLPGVTDLIGLDQQADVFVAEANSGRYTVLTKSQLACRLVHMPLRHVSTGADRAELAGMRNLIFDPEFILPEECQVEVDGTRWSPRPGTFGAYRDWNSNLAYRRCDVVRQQVSAF